MFTYDWADVVLLALLLALGPLFLYAAAMAKWNDWRKKRKAAPR